MTNCKDREILRRLADEYASVASQNIQAENMNSWRNLNDLKESRPLVWITEEPLSEFNDVDDLKLQCENEVARNLEFDFRSNLFKWRNFPGDMVFERYMNIPMWLDKIDFGVDIEESTIVQGSGNISSHQYVSQFKTMEDAMKIVPPEVSVSPMNEKMLEMAQDTFGDILPARNHGIPVLWFAPWDWITMRWNIEDALMALYLEPELVHMIMQRFLDANIDLLRRFYEQNLLRFHEGVYRVGSGGYGCVSELPQSDCDPNHIRPLDQWGCGIAQIFGEVSPEMHEEFALRYERQWMEQFGLTYYGCCEPLHNKISILRSVKNLRKISASPWCDLEKLIEQVGRDYVISLKPNPAIFATDEFNAEEAEKQLRRSMDILKGANVEIIMKDISTVRGDYRRLVEWSKIAKRVCEDYV